MKTRHWLLLWAIAASLGFVCAMFSGSWETKLHYSWNRGYTECMGDVVDALASHDEVRLGNLVINEPNAYVSDMTFFVVDPNRFGAVIDACNVTFTDGTYNSLCDGYEYPENEVKE